MALATQCPHCGTMFRVAADQLKLRGGIVRCGACQQVFDGNKELVDLSAAPPLPPVPAAPATPILPPAAPADEIPAASVPEPLPEAGEQAAPAEAQDEDGVPIYTLEFDRTFSPFGIIPQVSKEAQAQDAAQALPEDQPEREDPTVSATLDAPAPAAQAAASELEGGDTAVLDLPVDEELVAAPPPDAHEALEEAMEEAHEEVLEEVQEEAPEEAPEEAQEDAPKPARRRVAAPDAPPMLLRESSGGQAAVLPPPPPPKSPRARAAESRARRSKLTPTRIEPPKLRVPESDEPEFVRRSRQREQSGKAVRIALAAGSALLLLLLAAQAVYTFRDTLAARYPGMRPALVSACTLLGCKVGLPANIEKLVIETGELTTLGGNAYGYTTLLRNEGALVQAWPSIELTLLDADEKPLVRRVFGPRDYLPQSVPASSGIAARAEQPVRLHFRLEGLEPSGYHIAVFYP